MHFTGTIWRPPYEAASLLIQVTAGCTHHRCKFCTLYNDLPFPFRMSPLEDIESDLLEVQTMVHSPLDRLSAALRGQPQEHHFDPGLASHHHRNPGSGHGCDCLYQP